MGVIVEPHSAVFAAFLGAWRGEAGAIADGGAELEALVEEVVARGLAAFPDVRLPAERFAHHVAARVPAGTPLVEALASVRAADLFLACACAERDAEALAEFERLFGGEFLHVLGRVRGAPIAADDFGQACREKLFAADPPKIADYSGQGDLRNWLRVALTRKLIDLSRKKSGREELREANAFAELEAPGGDVELDYLKRLYAGEFKTAFEEAAGALDADERNILRQHFAHGLGIDRLAALYRIHRATAARRVARARESLLSGTRRRLMDRLRLRPAELDSVMRMIESRVAVSFHRVLGSDEPWQP